MTQRSGSGRAIARAAWFVIASIVLCLIVIALVIRGAAWLALHVHLK